MTSLKQYKAAQATWLKKKAKEITTKYKQYDQWWPLAEAAADVLGLSLLHSSPEYMPTKAQMQEKMEAIQKTWSDPERLVRERFFFEDKEDIEKYLQLEEYNYAERMGEQDGGGSREDTRLRGPQRQDDGGTTHVAVGSPARPAPKRSRTT